MIAYFRCNTKVMTVGASSIMPTRAFLFGDLLLSAEANSLGHEIYLPVQEVKLASGVGRTITGLAQKLSIITPDLAIGWSGSKIAARGIILDAMDHL
jgi:hypothetical protein